MQSNQTALFWASMRGHCDIVKELLQRGADANIRNNVSSISIRLTQLRAVINNLFLLSINRCRSLRMTLLASVDTNKCVNS